MDPVPMTDLHRKAIANTATLLLENLNPTMARRLQTAGIFTRQDLQDINDKGDRPDKVNKIIDILPMKEDKAFEEFCKALYKTGQEVLAVALERNLSRLEAESSGGSVSSAKRKLTREEGSRRDVKKLKQKKAVLPAKETGKYNEESNSDAVTTSTNKMDEMVTNEVHTDGGDSLVKKTTQNNFANAVCRIETKKGQDTETASGFYAKVEINGEDVFGVFTCNHVLRHKRDAKNSNVFFGYDKPGQGHCIILKPGQCFKTNADLDYSLVGVDKAELDSLELIPIEFLEEPKVSKDEVICIYQHPGGRTKEFSAEKIKDVQRPFVYYKAETEGGSSGSPVIYKSSLLAVHHGGSKKQKHNIGTLCSEILSHLQTGKYTKPRDYQPPGGWKQGQPDNIQLRHLARKLAIDWQELGTELEVDQGEIGNIAVNPIYVTPANKAFAMLQLWRDAGENRTFETLGKALIVILKYNLAKDFCMY